MEEDFPFKIEVRDHTFPFDNHQEHAHDYFQVCYLNRGSCLHQVNGKQATLVKGDLFSIPPDYRHKIDLLPDKELQIILIDFMPFLLDRSLRDLKEMHQFIDFAFIQPFAALNDEPLPKLNLSHEGQAETEALIADMMRELELKRDGYTLLVKADLTRLLVIAGREYARFMAESPGQRIVSANRKGMEEAVAYIGLHYCEELTLQSAAAKACVSPSYFSSMFKAWKGVTFVEYVTALRLKEAQRLLRETDRSVEEIALAAGFNHLTHFHRVFKRHTGLTPHELRKRSLN
jgi:AraC-like DNA-binding protein